MKPYSSHRVKKIFINSVVRKQHLFLLFVRTIEACTGNTNSNYYCKWEVLAQGQEIIGECVNLSIELQ